MKHGFISTKKHGRVHYLEAGEGPVLVLLHSNGASAFQYEQVLPGLVIREVNRLTR
jgi:3-oxoadipate enol-lactonase